MYIYFFLIGEKLAADEEAAKNYVIELEKIIKEKNLTKCQVFNMDESGLQFKMTPSKVIAPKDVSQVSGPKKQFERITFAVCCNADGSLKLPIMAIGKSKNPQCFKHLDKNNLPVWYRNQKSAWVDSDIFKEWFEKEFVPRVEEFLFSKNMDLTAILLVDNCKAHKYLKYRKIEVLFFPPNVTSLIQPADQGIIMATKLYYQQKLMKEVLKNQEEKGLTLIEFLKTVRLDKVIFWLAAAWDDVQSNTILKCWKPLMPVKKQDAATQTTEELDTVQYFDLDSSVDSDLQIASESSESTIDENCTAVKDLLSLIRKVDGYETITEKVLISWIKKSNCGM